MAKATYFFANGTGALVSVPCEADKDGNLKRDGEVIVTGAKATTSPESGSYVLDAAPKKPTKKEEDAEAKRLADEAEAQRLAAEAEAEAQRQADEAKRLEDENPPLIP